MKHTAPDDLLKAALSYARAGYPVVPGHSVASDDQCTCGRKQCGSPGKRPRIRKWPKRATTDEATIRSWWRRWPSANVCIATGEASGVVVLDVDPRHDGEASLKVLIEADDGLLETPTSRTGGGGYHFFFQHPGGRLANKVNVLPGIDIRGDGGYVVAPPSIHVSGEVYSWIRPLVRL